MFKPPKSSGVPSPRFWDGKHLVEWLAVRVSVIKPDMLCLRWLMNSDGLMLPPANVAHAICNAHYSIFDVRDAT